jgi:hypothetical protein
MVELFATNFVEGVLYFIILCNVLTQLFVSLQVLYLEVTFALLPRFLSLVLFFLSLLFSFVCSFLLDINVLNS